jgi:hypothetical protein
MTHGDMLRGHVTSWQVIGLVVHYRSNRFQHCASDCASSHRRRVALSMLGAGVLRRGSIPSAASATHMEQYTPGVEWLHLEVLTASRSA